MTLPPKNHIQTIQGHPTHPAAAAMIAEATECPVFFQESFHRQALKQMMTHLFFNKNEVVRNVSSLLTARFIIKTMDGIVLDEEDSPRIPDMLYLFCATDTLSYTPEVKAKAVTVALEFIGLTASNVIDHLGVDFYRELHTELLKKIGHGGLVKAIPVFKDFRAPPPEVVEASNKALFADAIAHVEVFCMTGERHKEALALVHRLAEAKQVELLPFESSYFYPAIEGVVTESVFFSRMNMLAMDEFIAGYLFGDAVVLAWREKLTKMALATPSYQPPRYGYGSVQRKDPLKIKLRRLWMRVQSYLPPFMRTDTDAMLILANSVQKPKSLSSKELLLLLSDEKPPRPGFFGRAENWVLVVIASMLLSMVVMACALIYSAFQYTSQYPSLMRPSLLLPSTVEPLPELPPTLPTSKP